MAITTIDNRIRLNIPLEFDVSKKLVPAYVGSHFFNEQGEYKASKLKQPKRKYAMTDLVNRKVNSSVLEALKYLTKQKSGLKGVNAVYSKHRLGFRTNFYFLKVEVRRKKLILDIKSSEGWVRTSVSNYNEITNYEVAIKKAYNLSFKPVLKRIK